MLNIVHAAPRPAPTGDEYHVTVAGDPMFFHEYVTQLARLFKPLECHIKPLWIELNNFERQLMTASNFNPCDQLMQAGFRIVRVKHERFVPPDRNVEFADYAPVLAKIDVEPEPTRLSTHKPCYYECHVKLDGSFGGDMILSSRDLFRENRWYVTKRETCAFNPEAFVQYVQRAARPSVVVEVEYEACVHDSYPQLDARWMRQREGTWRP